MTSPGQETVDNDLWWLDERGGPKVWHNTDNTATLRYKEHQYAETLLHTVITKQHNVPLLPIVIAAARSTFCLTLHTTCKAALLRVSDITLKQLYVRLVTSRVNSCTHDQAPGQRSRCAAWWVIPALSRMGGLRKLSRRLLATYPVVKYWNKARVKVNILITAMF